MTSVIDKNGNLLFTATTELEEDVITYQDTTLTVIERKKTEEGLVIVVDTNILLEKA